MTLARYVLDPVSGLSIIRGPDNPSITGAAAPIGSSYINDASGSWASKVGPADTDWATFAATSGFLPLSGGSLNPGANLTVPGAISASSGAVSQALSGSSALDLGTTHATYTGAVLYTHTARAGSSAFQHIYSTSNGAVVFVVDGAGNVSGRDYQASRGDGTGVYYFAGSGSRYIYWDGSNYNLPGGFVVSQGFTGTSGAIPGSPGNFTLQSNSGSPYSARLTFGSDNSGWKFVVTKNVSGTLTDLLTVSDSGVVTAATFSGNLTGTLLTGAQPNITSVGTLIAPLFLSTADNGGVALRIGPINPIGPAFVAGWGSLIQFSGGSASVNWNSEQSDPLYLGRYNTADNSSEIRMFVGDDQTDNDRFSIVAGPFPGALLKHWLGAGGGFYHLGSGSIDGSLTVAGQITGNLSGTVLTAAQPNITSVGTLTGLYVNNTVTTSGSSSGFNLNDRTGTGPTWVLYANSGLFSIYNTSGVGDVAQWTTAGLVTLRYGAVARRDGAGLAVRPATLNATSFLEFQNSVGNQVGYVGMTNQTTGDANTHTYLASLTGAIVFLAGGANPFNIYSTHVDASVLISGTSASFPSGVTANVTGNVSGTAGSVAGWYNPATGANAQTFPHLAGVKADGGMEVGRYIDFHAPGKEGVDYGVRLDSYYTGTGRTLSVIGSLDVQGTFSATDMQFTGGVTQTGNQYFRIENTFVLVAQGAAAVPGMDFGMSGNVGIIESFDRTAGIFMFAPLSLYGSRLDFKTWTTTSSGIVSLSLSPTAATFLVQINGNLTGNVTGNLTGTVLTAAQPNITSLGSLGTLTVNSGITSAGGPSISTAGWPRGLTMQGIAAVAFGIGGAAGQARYTIGDSDGNLYIAKWSDDTATATGAYILTFSGADGTASFGYNVSAPTFIGNLNGNASGTAGSVAGWNNPPTSNNGQTWPHLVGVKSDGVMEVGSVIDFHNTSAAGTDYVVRLDSRDQNGAFGALHIIGNFDVIGTLSANSLKFSGGVTQTGNESFRIENTFTFTPQAAANVPGLEFGMASASPGADAIIQSWDRSGGTPQAGPLRLNATVIRLYGGGASVTIPQIAVSVSSIDFTVPLNGTSAVFTGTIGGTLNTAAQPNITSLGALTGGLSITAGQLSVTSPFAAGSAYGVNITGAAGAARDIFLAGQAGVSNGFTVQYNGTSMVYQMHGGSLTLDSGTVTAPSFTGTLNTAAQPNVTSLGSLTGLTVNGQLLSSQQIVSGSATAGLGGGFVSIDDGGTRRWAAGVLGAVGYRNYQIFDIVNSRAPFYIDAATGLTTIGNGLTVSGGNITGTVTALLNFVNQSGSRYTTDLNTLLQTGFYNGEGSPANSPVAYGQIIVAKGVDTGLQITGGYNNDELYFRGWASNGTTFYGWRRLLHNGNFNLFAPTLTGVGASGAWSISAASVTGFTTPSTTNLGQVWPGLISIKADGVSEVGRYLDFHAASGDAVDYTVRLDGGGAGSTTLSLLGSLSATGNVAAYDFYASRSGTSGVVYLGSNGLHYLYFDGTNYNMPGGSLILNSGNISLSGNITTGANTVVSSGSGYLILTSGSGDVYLRAAAGNNTRISDTQPNQTTFIGAAAGAASFLFGTNNAQVAYINSASMGLQGIPLVVSRSGGTEHIRFDTTGNGDLWMSGGGQFRIINGAYSVETFKVDNSGNTRAYGNLTSGGYLRSDVGLQMPAASYIFPTGTAGSGFGSAIQMREYNGGGAQTGVMNEAPRLAFHWSGRVASSIAMDTAGTIGIWNNPGTAYEAFRAIRLYASAGHFIAETANYGIYNTATNSRIQSDTTAYWSLYSGDNSSAGLRMYLNNGTFLGYSYGDSAGFGTLDSTGSWASRVITGGGRYEMWGVIRAMNNTVDLNRVGTVEAGIAFYGSGNKAWRQYMAPSGAGNGPTGITPSAGSYVTSWAMRSFIENTAAYGFIWEVGGMQSTTPTTIMELSATGPTGGLTSLKVWGDIVSRRTANTGVIYFGDAYTYIFYDNTIFNFAGQSLGNINNVTTAGYISVGTNVSVNNNGLGYGLVGQYVSSKYRLVYAMGGAYMLAADGSTLGNLYGLFYGFDATLANGGNPMTGRTLNHGVGLAANGTLRVYLGDGIWTSMGIYAGADITLTNTGTNFKNARGQNMAPLVVSTAAPSGTAYEPGTLWAQVPA